MNTTQKAASAGQPRSEWKEAENVIYSDGHSLAEAFEYVKKHTDADGVSVEVRDDTMAPSLQHGDTIIVGPALVKDIEDGEVIAFRLTSQGAASQGEDAIGIGRFWRIGMGRMVTFDDHTTPPRMLNSDSHPEGLRLEVLRVAELRTGRI